MRSPNCNLVESVGSLLGVSLVSVGSLISPWNTISLQCSSLNVLSKWGLQKSSPNELSKFRLVWSLLGVRFAVSLLEVQWESGGSAVRVQWEFVGSPVGV
jgi:hypothetical protein